MSPEFRFLIAITLAYLVGSIPFGWIVARLVRGIDIRQHGSGNIGATNVGRVVGTKWGFVTLLLDLLKGLLPTALLPPWLLATQHLISGAVACGMLAILGHIFPMWLGFRGGKGVGTALGVAVILSPWGTLAAVAVFVLSMYFWRIVSLSSMLGALAYGIVHLARYTTTVIAPGIWPLTLFSLGIPALIIVRHRANLGRLFRGTEPRYSFGPKAETSSTTSPVPATETQPAPPAE